MSKKKVSSPVQEKRSNTNFNQSDKTVSSNELTLVLTHLTPNLVSWEKELMFQVTWMGELRESQGVKIQTSSEHLLGATIPLYIKFHFPIEGQLTPAYLTQLINSPVVITLLESSGTLKVPSGKKGSSSDTALGYICVDVLPLILTQTNTSEHITEDVTSNLSSFDQHSPSDTSSSEGKHADEKSSRKVEVEMKLEPAQLEELDLEVITPANRVDIGLTAYLYLDTPLPDGCNILTVTVESAHNLPPPHDNTLTTTGMRVLLGMTIPVDGLAPPAPPVSEINTSFLRIHKGTEPPQESAPAPPTYYTVALSNGFPATQPDANYRSKWTPEDAFTSTAHYTQQRLPDHYDDVKFGEVLPPGAAQQRHIQFNTMYRVWLTRTGEAQLKQHMNQYGVWPVQILVDHISGAPSQERSRTKLGKETVEYAALKLLALLDVTDMTYPGITTCRVLAEFQPLPPLAELLEMTGMEIYPLDASEATATMVDKDSSPGSTTAVPATKAGSNKSNHQGKSFVSETKPDRVIDIVLSQESPFSIVVTFTTSAPLTEKPDQEVTLSNLRDLMQTKPDLYFPDLTRQEAENVRESFERALAQCTQMFYADYEDFEKIKAKLNETKTVDTTEPDQTKTDSQCHQSKLTGKHAGRAKKSDVKLCPQKPKSHQLATEDRSEKSSPRTKACKEGPVQASDHEPPAFNLTIPTDFKRYITQSGALSKCLLILEEPLRRYVQYTCVPDGDGVAYKMETLSDIHATLMGVMSQVVDRLECSGVERNESAPGKDCPKVYPQTVNSLRWAQEYTAQGYPCDARRLLHSHIQSCVANYSNNGTVWADHARWCLANQLDLDEARESLRQSLYLGVTRDALLMLSYVAYRIKDWENASLYFTSLSNLFDQDPTCWTALHIFYLQLGLRKQAATTLQVARTCLVRQNEEEKRDSQRNFTHGSATAHQLTVTADADSATLFANELTWTEPVGERGTSGNNVYLAACAQMLALNMFEFAEACIGEYLSQSPTRSLLVNYYIAVSHYKQGNFQTSLSYLGNIEPQYQCLPVLVLRFHIVYSLWNIEKRSQQSSTHKSRPDECRQLYFNLRVQLTDAKYRSLRFLVLLRLCDLGIRQVHDDLFNATRPRLVVSTGDELSGSRGQSGMTSTSVGQTSTGIRTNSNIVASGSTIIGTHSIIDTSSHDEGGSNRRVEDTETKILNQVETDLLVLARDYDSPLVWYYLGLLYLKRPNLSRAEHAFNQANKLDPRLGDPWAGLALVNYALRRPSWFVTCRDQARKYGASPTLLAVLTKMSLLIKE